jgi:hypothetical protein
MCVTIINPTVIVPGKVKVDLTNFDLKLREKFLYTLF